MPAFLQGLFLLPAISCYAFCSFCNIYREAFKTSSVRKWERLAPEGGAPNAESGPGLPFRTGKLSFKKFQIPVGSRSASWKVAHTRSFASGTSNCQSGLEATMPEKRKCNKFQQCVSLFCARVSKIVNIFCSAA